MPITGTFKRRGSALVITMVFALVLATIGASFISLTTSSRKINESNYSYHALQSVMERGVDQAMYAFGKYRNSGFTAWPAGWIANGTHGYSRNFGDISLGNGRTATLKVTIQNLPFDATGMDPSTSPPTTLLPYIVAEALYSGGASSPSSSFSRQIVAILQPTTSNSITGGMGLNVKGNMVFKGSASNINFDSYTSAKDPITNKASPYGGANISDGITVATAGVYASTTDPVTGVTTTTDPVAGTGSVYGYALVGGGDADKAFAGFHVWGANSDPAYKSSGMDPARVGTGYSGNFTLPTTPSASLVSKSLGTITNDTTLTGSADPKSPIYYSVSSIALNGNKTITVSGNVVLIMTGGVDLGGNGTIKLYNDSLTSSSLKIYTPGDVTISGNGVVNAAKDGTALDSSLLTGSMYIYGTNPTPGGQKVTFNGNGSFSGVVFAPNADATFNGSGSSGVFYGALTTNSATVNGKVNFHFDQALGAGMTTTSVSAYALNYWIEPKTKTSMSNYGL